MFCKKCNKVTVCKAVDPKQVQASVSTGRRFYRTSHEDLHYFRRGRICLTCNSAFLTAELRESFLTELTELREALGQIKVNAEAYVTQAEAASESLNQLSASLEVLRALKIYKSQNKKA
jgi:hypothetical protein